MGLTAALCQLDIAWENPRATRNRIERLLADAPARADWLVFPETTLTGFTRSAAADLRPDDEAFFRGVAAARNAFVTFGAVVGGRNCAVTLDRTGRRIARFAKMRLFSPSGEQDVRRPGRRTVTASLDGVRVTFFVCYDLRFADLFWRTAPRTDVYAVIANWPEPRTDAWLTLLKARAIENQAFVVGVNRAGADPENRFAGRSAVFGPDGALVADCGQGETIAAAELDTDAVATARARFPALADRAIGRGRSGRALRSAK